MATNKKTLEFTAKNVKSFASWLKRFSLIDNSLLLEIDQVKSSFISKSYNEERSCVKMSSIKFDDAGFVVKPNKDSKRIKVGIFNIPRLIKTIDQYGEEEFTLTIEFQELVNESETQYAAEKLLLKNKNLKMNVDCTSLNIFKYISDDLFIGSIAAIEVIGKFDLDKSMIEKINTLNSLDSDNKIIEFNFDKDGNINVSGKTYELLISTTKVPEAKLSIFKEQYAALDVENYNVALGEDRLVFTSSDSQTITVISKAEDDKS
jgi:hypothetical protein